MAIQDTQGAQSPGGDVHQVQMTLGKSGHMDYTDIPNLPDLRSTSSWWECASKGAPRKEDSLRHTFITMEMTEPKN